MNIFWYNLMITLKESFSVIKLAYLKVADGTDVNCITAYRANNSIAIQKKGEALCLKLV